VIDLGPKSKTAAVISSYAQPLLEGCGTIKKGDLRVVGKTEPVPFITLFVSDAMEAGQVEELMQGLQGVSRDIQVLQALESLIGFKMIKQPETLAKKK
jgi:ABC-type phosphate/phosphonate transport system substrate-binding protein